MITTEKIQLTVSGPHCQCASEYGYGDYYLICDDMVEWDNVLVPRGDPIPMTALGLAVNRVKSRIKREHFRDYYTMPFSGFAKVNWRINS